MYTLKKTLAVILLVMPLLAQATTVYGPCAFGNAVFTNLTCYGPATLHGTIVRHTLTVNGPLDTENATIRTMNIKGEAHINNSRIGGNALIYGPLFSYNSLFLASVYSYTPFMQLVHTLIKGNVTIRSSMQLPTLQLLDASYIKHNLIFSGIAGTVFFSHDSALLGEIVHTPQSSYCAV
jgi:hypothetical protein